jgi:hypothetical protein
MSGFRDYLASTAADFSEGAGDIGRHAYADIGDSYQEFLMADAGISEPYGHTGDMVHIGPEAETIQGYQSALLEHGVAVGLETEADHWREQEMQPEPEAPDISAPEIDIE